MATLETIPFNNHKRLEMNQFKESVTSGKFSKSISDKQDLLLESLKKFYKKKGNKELLLPIIKQQTTISLRLLDWLVTNYSKQYNISYEINGKECSDNKNFSIWLDYKNQLKAYSKKAFDPFCRRKRIFYNILTDEVTYLTKNGKSDYEYKKILEKYQKRNDGFVTTVGQLNFFRWAISHRVVDYAFDNLSKIESDMLTSADNRKVQEKGKRRKRQSSRISNSVFKHDVKVVIQFA